MLFVKYLSDVYAEKRAEYSARYNGDEERIQRAMSRDRFVMDETSTFGYLYNNRKDPEIGQKINTALAAIERNNSAKLHEVFRAIDFNSSVDFGDVKTKNAILENLLKDFNGLFFIAQDSRASLEYFRLLFSSFSDFFFLFLSYFLLLF